MNQLVLQNKLELLFFINQIIELIFPINQHMDYNTQRKSLALPEYGRNIHQMIDHLFTIEDRQERSRLAKVIIGVMGNMNPHLRDINDFKHKLWDHIHIMSDFKLDIESPYPKPDISIISDKPLRVPYPTKPIKFKHYGRTLEQMIDKAIEMEEGELRQALTLLIANHMKKSYLIWNKESVSDEDIIRDMGILSGGKLKLSPELKLNEIREVPLPHKSKKKFQQRKK